MLAGPAVRTTLLVHSKLRVTKKKNTLYKQGEGLSML